MWDFFWILTAIAAFIAAALAALVWRPLRTALRQNRLTRARKEFHRQRERLEAKFFQLASASGRPRGLEWTGCDFDDDVVYARDRRTGELCALVAVTISFEALEGGGMEDVEAVGNLRAATAVFRAAREKWATDGRALFNLNPAEAVRYFQDNLEIVCEEPAHHA
jgi:hypothetical protein